MSPRSSATGPVMSARVKSGPSVGVAVLGVEVHELDARDGEACLLDDVGLDCGVGQVLAASRLPLDFDLGDDPGVALLGEGVDGDEDVVLAEGGFEDGWCRRARALVGCSRRLGRGRRWSSSMSVAPGNSWLGAVADALARVEAGLEGGVGGELGGAGLV